MTEARVTPPESRIEALLAEGQALLVARRCREAALVFERVLLHDAECARARCGLERARAAESEEARRREARIQTAHEAIAEGDRDTAREILEGLLESGGDRDLVLSLLDRLDERRGLVALRPPGLATTRARVMRAAEPGGGGRRAFAFGWTLLTLTLAASVAFSWERLVERLVEAPAPSAHLGPPATRLPRPSAGEVALAEARDRAERGDATGALGALDRILPEDAAYPYARQMRERLGAPEAEETR